MNSTSAALSPVAHGEHRPGVVVLGSKPDAYVPPGESIYCANASVGCYPDEIARFGEIVNVVSGTEMARRPRPVNQAIYERRYADVMRAAKVARLILIEAVAHPGVRQQMIDDGYPLEKIEFCTQVEKRALMKRLAGTTEPVLTVDAFRISFKSSLLELYGLIKVGVMLKIGKPMIHSALFRPSTGILTLLFAIRDHGSEADYTLAAIGAGQRGVYRYGVFEREIVTDRTEYLHVLADLRVLRLLGRSYSISTTDPGLAQVCGLRLIERPPSSGARA